MGENKICAECGQEITGQVLKADGKEFHPECFKCQNCGELLKGAFFHKDGKRICEACTPKNICARCKKVITGAATKVGDLCFHPECFTCEGCNEKLTGGYFKVDGKFMCKSCAEKGQEGTRQRYTCRKCKKPIEGKVVFGDREDAFHEECFVCEECGCSLETFVLDEGRSFKFQEARYVCEPCFKNSSEKEKASEAKPCVVCKEPCLPDDSSLHLLDGYAIHWRCFKCAGCGKAEEPTGDTSTMRLLRSRVELCKQGKYYCDACFKPAATNLPPEADLKVDRKLHVGCYLGKKVAGARNETSYAIRLMEGGKCWLDCTTTDPISSGTWHAEGTYEEVVGDGGQVTKVKFTNESIPFGVGPEKGKVYEFTVEKGATNSDLIHEGIRCPLQVGVPDFEINEMMRPPEKQHAPQAVSKPAAAPEKPGEGAGILVDGETTSIMQGSAGVMERPAIDMSTGIVKTPDAVAAPAKPVPKDVPEGCFSLEDLQNPDVWKVRGVDASCREQYLSDAAFEAVFGVSKADFEKLPKWKKDNQKKQHKLF